MRPPEVSVTSALKTFRHGSHLQTKACELVRKDYKRKF
jgi:hypothetical protein